MKYTPEMKAEALKSIEDIGVAKTAEAKKISVQTLYKWRNEVKVAQKTEMQDANPDAAKNQKVLDAQELLENDRFLQEKITLLEVENATLRARLVKYRAALAAVLEEDR